MRGAAIGLEAECLLELGERLVVAPSGHVEGAKLAAHVRGPWRDSQCLPQAPHGQLVLSPVAVQGTQSGVGSSILRVCIAENLVQVDGLLDLVGLLVRAGELVLTGAVGGIELHKTLHVRYRLLGQPIVQVRLNQPGESVPAVRVLLLRVKPQGGRVGPIQVSHGAQARVRDDEERARRNTRPPQ